MVQQIMERTLNLFGHICRMKDNRLVKEVMFGMTKGQTSKGEEWCREWLEDIKEWCGEEIHTLNWKAQDRGTWRTMVKIANEHLWVLSPWSNGWMDGYTIYI